MKWHRFTLQSKDGKRVVTIDAQGEGQIGAHEAMQQEAFALGLHDYLIMHVETLEGNLSKAGNVVPMRKTQ